MVQLSVGTSAACPSDPPELLERLDPRVSRGVGRRHQFGVAAQRVDETFEGVLNTRGFQPFQRISCPGAGTRASSVAPSHGGGPFPHLAAGVHGVSDMKRFRKTVPGAARAASTASVPILPFMARLGTLR